MTEGTDYCRTSNTCQTRKRGIGFYRRISDDEEFEDDDNDKVE
jgi:hypothetical protein